MASERLWFAASQLFTADGTDFGLIQVSDVAGFYVKAKVRISSTSQQPQLLEIKRIEQKTRIFVGPIGGSMQDRTDVSAYLVAHGARIDLYEQQITRIPPEDIQEAVYAREPIVAIRSVLVDQYGSYWNDTNPLPVKVDGGVNIENASISVDLTHLDNFPNPGDTHDSVRIGDGVNTATITPSTLIGVRSLDVMMTNKLIRRSFNEVEITSKNSNGDPTAVVFRQGTSVVANMSLVYDSDGDIQKITVTYP